MYNDVMKKLEKYRPYIVHFFDHCIGDCDEIEIFALGYFIKETKNCYIFSHWLIQNQKEETIMNNLEPFSLVKKAIIEVIPIE